MLNNIYSCQCILLSKKNCGEGHIVLELLTKEQGLIKATAFGAQRLSKRFKGAIDYFKIIEAELEYKNQNIHIKHIFSSVRTVLNEFKDISNNIKKFSAGSYILELCSMVLHPLEPDEAINSEIFNSLLNTLKNIEKNTDEQILDTVYSFTVELYKKAGFIPELKQKKGTKNILEHIQEFNFTILEKTPKSFILLENVFSKPCYQSEDNF